MTDLRQGVTPAVHRALDLLDANRPLYSSIDGSADLRRAVLLLATEEVIRAARSTIRREQRKYIIKAAARLLVIAEHLEAEIEARGPLLP